MYLLPYVLGKWRPKVSLVKLGTMSPAAYTLNFVIIGGHQTIAAINSVVLKLLLESAY